MKLPRLALVAATALGLGLAACNNGSNNSFNPGNCTPPGTTVMVYPIPGATGVPASTQTIYVASVSSALANGNYGTAIAPPNGLPVYNGGNFVRVSPSAVPKPAASPSFANPFYYSSNVGGLSGGSTYSIGFNQNVTCIPTNLGAFTTN